MKVMSDIFKYAPEGADSLKQSLSGKGNLQWFKGLDVHIGDGKYANTITARWQTIATRPTEPATQKTVADAWEALKEKMKPSSTKNVAVCKLAQSGWLRAGDFTFVGEGFDTDIFDFVCTREQFEAYGREQEAKQEGEKWTHVYAGDKCYLLEPDKDADGYYAVKTDCGLFDFARENELTPIKPTITKAEAWDKATSQDVESSMSVGAILDEYEVK
jgi:hypothetical protein